MGKRDRVGSVVEKLVAKVAPGAYDKHDHDHEDPAAVVDDSFGDSLRCVVQAFGVSVPRLLGAIRATHSLNCHDLSLWLETTEAGPRPHVEPQDTARLLPLWAQRDLTKECPTNPKRKFMLTAFLVSAKYSYLPGASPAIAKLCEEWDWRYVTHCGPKRGAQAIVFAGNDNPQTYVVGFTPALVGAFTMADAAARVLHFPAVELAYLLEHESKLTPNEAGLPVHKDVLGQVNEIWEGGLHDVLAGVAALPSGTVVYMVGYSYGSPKAHLSALLFKQRWPHSQVELRVLGWGGFRWMGESTVPAYSLLLGEQAINFVASSQGKWDPVFGGEGGSTGPVYDPVAGWPGQSLGFRSVPFEYHVHNHTGRIARCTFEDGYVNEHERTATSKEGFQYAFLKLHFAYIKAITALQQSVQEPDT